MRLDHVVLWTRNPRASMDFYSRVVGLEPVRFSEFEAGSEPFSTRNALDQDIIELTNDFTWIKGNHTVTFGTSNQFFEFDNLFIQNAFGSYEFSDLDQLESGIAREWEYTVVNPGQPETQQFGINQIGLYRLRRCVFPGALRSRDDVEPELPLPWQSGSIGAERVVHPGRLAITNGQQSNVHGSTVGCRRVPAWGNRPELLQVIELTHFG